MMKEIPADWDVLDHVTCVVNSCQGKEAAGYTCDLHG